MQLCITKIKHHPAASQHYELVDDQLTAAAHGYTEFSLAGPVIFKGQVTNNGDGMFMVSGVYQATLQLTCSRCLSSFELPLTGEINALFGASALADAEGELAVHSFSGDNIELDDLLLSEISFALPMQPLCREDCRGLCPECGTNLNHDACSCVKETIDPRWAKLAYFEFNGDE